MTPPVQPALDVAVPQPRFTPMCDPRSVEDAAAEAVLAALNAAARLRAAIPTT